MRNYKHAPIEEAMCEITFGSLSSPFQWDLTLPGRVQQHRDLKDIYVGPASQQHVQQILAEAGAQPGQPQNVALTSSLLRVLIPTADSKALLGIGPNSLTISSLRDYEGWTKFKPRIETALRAYQDVAKPKGIVRITLRYINRLVVPETGAVGADHYLEDMPPTHVASVEGTNEVLNLRLSAYNYRKEFTSSDEVKIVISQASLLPQKPETNEFLLDIEAVSDHAHLTVEETIKRVERLHVVEGAVFESFIKQPARELFDAA